MAGIYFCICKIPKWSTDIHSDPLWLITQKNCFIRKWKQSILGVGSVWRGASPFFRVIYSWVFNEAAAPFQMARKLWAAPFEPLPSRSVQGFLFAIHRWRTSQELWCWAPKSESRPALVQHTSLVLISLFCLRVRRARSRGAAPRAEKNECRGWTFYFWTAPDADLAGSAAASSLR